MRFSPGLRQNRLLKLMTSVVFTTELSAFFNFPAPCRRRNSKEEIMLTSLAFIFIFGLTLAAVCERLKLPRILGMLATGIILGPCVLGLLDEKILSISSELRQIALIIILIKAGLSLDIADLKKIGRPALLMSFLPACFEVAAYTAIAPSILGITRVEAALMGSVLAAVSPAVVVPKMVKLMDEGYGTKKGIPQLILAGASLDDVFVIVLFTTFTSLAQGGNINAVSFARIPVSIVCGIAVGSVFGLAVSSFFEFCFKSGRYIRNSTKVVIVLGLSFILVSLEDWLEGIIPLSGLLGVMAMALIIKTKCVPSVSSRLSQKFAKLWIAAEVILFVLVGAAVDIDYALSAGFGVVIMIFLALIFRVAGVFFCVLGTKLSRRERLFCMIAYIPKATVQAAIGSVPLSLGLPCGALILTVAVAAIIITAPLGAFGMDMTYKKFLEKEE